MVQSRSRVTRLWMVAVLVFSGLTAVGAQPATAQVTALRGSAVGYSLSVSLFDGPANVQGPAPTVTLPSGGSAAPVTGSAPSASAIVGPANLFSSGSLEVSTQGTLSNGSVTSSSRVSNLNRSQDEVLTAGAVASTCTASGTGVSGSTTVTSGSLQTDSGDDDPENSIPDHPPTTMMVPTNPAPNTIIEGHIHVGQVTDNFRYVFNEQVRNADGSITVNAAHQYLLGPLAKGDIVIGQSVCGVTGTAAGVTTTIIPGATTTTTTTAGATTTTVPAATTTTAAGATTTTAAAPSTTVSTAATTTTSPGGGTTGSVGGGAYGYFVSVGLFGGPAVPRGPVPTVSLPAAGSATPVTANAASGSGVYGPATIFSSGPIEVSTAGVPGGTVTSSAKITGVNASGQEVLTAASLASACTVSATGATGSASISGGRLTTSEGANLDSAADDTIVQVPADPSPNTTYTGKIETVGDTFRYVFNEQIRNADGSITVNGAHLYLLGPTAVGELIIGQSRCSRTAGGTTAGGGGAGVGGTVGGGSGAGGGLVSTGLPVAQPVALALLLLVFGWATTVSTAGARLRRRVRSKPWDKRTLR